MTATRTQSRESLLGAQSALMIMRIVWLAIAALAVVVTILGFLSFFAGDRALVSGQGPLAVQPDLARELQTTLFDVSLLESAQITIHIAGWILFGTAAALLFIKRSDDPVAVLSSAMLLTLGTALFVPSGELIAENPAWGAPIAVIGVFKADPAFWRSTAGILVIMFGFLFPDGRFSSVWVKIGAVGFIGHVALWTVFPTVTIFNVGMWSTQLRSAWTAGLAVALATAQIHRYGWVSDAEIRRKTRLVVIALVSAVASFGLIWILDPDLAHGFDFGLVLVTDRLRAIYDLNLLVLLTASLFLFPLSILISASRYRLWDVDVIVNRALVYGSLTAVIAAVLFVVVALIGAFAGRTFGSAIGVGVTGILMVGLFQPLRSRIQSQVDKRFYRQKHDADLTVDAFVERIRDEPHIGVVEQILLEVIDETLRPSSAVFIGHHDLAASVHGPLVKTYVDAANEPLDLVGDRDTYKALGRLDPDRSAIVLPLVSQQKLLGVIELGPRLGERTYSGLDRQLLRRLAVSAAPAVAYAAIVEQQAEAAVDREKLDNEMRVAASIQRDLLPKELPDLDGWDVGALYEPAREIGGDLYDFIELPGNMWAIVVADVTDKGVPAAMVMATCRSVLRGVATGPDRLNPSEVLARVNELLIPDTPEGMFVTCFYAELDPSTGIMRFANAGHSLPAHWRDEVTEVRATGMPLGLMSGSTYDEGEVVIERGHSVLLFSDGLIEAHDPSGDMFGKARLQQWLPGRVGGQKLVEDLMELLSRFVGPGADLGDDVTLVALGRHGREASVRSTSVLDEFILPSEKGIDRKAADRVVVAVADRLAEPSLSRLRTAVGEATLNAVEHGNQNRAELPVHFLVEQTPDAITVSITDRGQLTEELEAQAPDLESRLSGERSPRGWGLFLIKNMVDEMRTVAAASHTTVQLVVYQQGGEDA